jgi:hypothetical protein
MGRRAVKAAQRGWSAAKATGKRVIRGAKRTYTAAKATAKRVITGARGVVRKTYHAAKRTAKAAVRGAKTIAQTVKKGTQTVVKGAHSVVKGAIASAKSLPQNATNTAKKAYRGAEKWLTENPKAAMALGAAAVVGGIGLTIATGGLAGLAIGGALAGAGTSAWLQGAQIADGAKDENGKPKTFSLKEVGTGALLGGAGGAIGGPLAAAAFKAAPTLVGVAGAGALGMGARSAHSNWQQGKKWSALAEGALAAPGALSFMSGKSLTAMFGRQALTTTGRSAQALVNGKAIQSAIHSGKSMAQTAVSQGRSLFGNGTSGFRPATVGGHPGALGQFQPRVQNVKSNSGQQTGGMSATPGKTTEKTSGIPEKPIAEGQPGIYEKKDFNVESIAAQRQKLKQPKPPQPPKQSPLDPWLESKGYQPKSQERSLSKAEYKAQAHQQRVSQRWASGSYSATNAEVQPRHMTKLEHALKFKNIGKPQKASQLVRELKAEMGPERYAALQRAYLQEQKGSALKGNQLKGAPYRVSEKHIDLMRPDDRFSVNSQNREALKGYFDVIAHGVEKPEAPTTKIRLQTLGRDVGVDHRTLAKLLKKQKGCYNDQPIRLLSCSTGNAPDGFAQNLANKTNKEVIAPSKTVWAGEKGELSVSSTEKTTDILGRERLFPKEPFNGEWRNFKPQHSTTRNRKTTHQPELERLLSKDEMPPIKGVPNDEFLRAKSSQEFIGSMTGWLSEHFPLPREIKIKIVKGARQTQQVQRTWQNRLEKEHGYSSESAMRLSRVPHNAGGVTYLNDMIILPKTIERIQSNRVSERIAAAKTVAHEWWHAMRKNQFSRFAPFEEGAADVFSEVILHKRLGAKVELNHSYKGLKEGADSLRKYFGDDWFFASRRASDPKQYLRKTFREAGFDKQKIDKVLDDNYNVNSDADGELWAEAVENLIQSKNNK